MWFLYVPKHFLKDAPELFVAELVRILLILRLATKTKRAPREPSEVEASST